MESYKAGTTVPGSLLTRSDQEFSGFLLLQQWIVQTELGAFLVTPGKVKLITLVREIPPPGEPDAKPEREPEPKPEPEKPAPATGP